MKKGLCLLLLLSLLTGCSGTPQSREVGTFTLISVFGAEGNTMYAAAEGRGEKEPVVLRGEGATPAAAVEDLSSKGDQVVSCAHVEHILLSIHSLYKLSAILSYAFQESEQSTETQLWVLDTPELFAVFSEGDMAKEMGHWKALGEDRQGFCPLTLREAAARSAAGEEVWIPTLSPGEEGLEFSGLTNLRGERVQGEAARGLALLMGERIRWTATAQGASVAVWCKRCQVRGESVFCTLEGVPVGGWVLSEGMQEQIETETGRAIVEAGKQIGKILRPTVTLRISAPT